MKKIITMLFLSLLVLGKIFACESIFDKIDGITCEIQYCLCKGSDIDIKVCDKVLEKVEQYEQALEKYRDTSKAAAKLKTKIEASKNTVELKEMRLQYQDLVYNAGRAFDEYNNAFENFLGEENLKLVESEEFQNEVWNVLGDNDYLDYNYLIK